MFPVTDGKIDRKGRVGVWTSKNGKAKSFRIGGQLYVQFPVKPKRRANLHRGRARKRSLPFHQQRKEYIAMTKKTSALTLNEVNNQLQIMEYIATNTKGSCLTPADRIILRNLDNQRQRLTRRYRSRRYA